MSSLQRSDDEENSGNRGDSTARDQLYFFAADMTGHDAGQQDCAEPRQQQDDAEQHHDDGGAARTHGRWRGGRQSWVGIGSLIAHDDATSSSPDLTAASRFLMPSIWPLR